MKKLFHNPWTFVSFIQSVILVIACYFLWNGSKNFINNFRLQQDLILWEYRNRMTEPLDSDLYLINTGYDKVMLPAIDSFGFQLGERPITDREKLYKLLSLLANSNSYKYIILDINFDTSFVTPIDSALFSLIASMRDIVVPSNTSGTGIPRQLSQKSGIAEFKASRKDMDFHRYQYIVKGKESIALKIWKEQTQGEFSKKWYGYTMNGKLCLNYSRISFPSAFIQYADEGREDGNYYVEQYNNLGEDILSKVGLLGDLSVFFDNKFVVIGDMIDDVHDTMVGPVPGPLIIYNAYLSLLDEHNVVPLWVWITIFVAFCISSFYTFEIICPLRSVKPFGKFMLSFVGYSLVFSVLGLIIYSITHILLNVAVISVFFTLETTIFKVTRKSSNPLKS